MTKDEALKMCFEYIETNVQGSKFASLIKKSLVNEALDRKAENARELGLDYQPEQEPVAKYSDIVSDGGLDPRNKFYVPPQRKPLTDEEIIQVASTPAGAQATTKGYVIPFARAIEAAHGIKGGA